MRWTTVIVVAEWVAAITAVFFWFTAERSGWAGALQAAVGAVPLVLAAVVARRAPGLMVGPLLGAAGLAFFVTMLPMGQAAGLFAGTWMLLYLPLAILILSAPDGRASSVFWRTAGWALFAVVALFIVVCALQWAIPAWSDPLTVAGLGMLPIFLGLLIVCASAPIARYRRADERTRMQLRWVFLAGMSLPLTLLLCWSSYLLLGGPELVGVGLAIMYLAIPAGVTIAVVRPELFDIDRAAVATVAAVVLSALGLGVLSFASAAVGVALVAWSPVAAIAGTTVVTAIAVAFFPLVRRGFDRLLYPERARAVAALHRLTERVNAGALEPELVEQTLQAALRDPGLVVGFRGLSDLTLFGLDGREVSPNHVSAPIRTRGDEIGVIIASPDRVKRPAAAVAHAAAPLVDAVRLRAELRRAVSEMEASRERMLRAGYEERRKLERDLHDGTQQRLVALGMQLRVLQRSGRLDAPVTASLDAAVAELGTAVAELRQIAHGMRPSALDDGLRAALVDLARLAPATIELDVHPGDLTDTIATTAYYVASEATTNALRHAGATRIRIEVNRGAHDVRVTVSDDGRGGARLRPTGGLTGLSDRVAAIGGELAVVSLPGAGTTVEASLPCVS